MLIAPGEGYIPEYTRTDLTDKLHDTFGFRTDYEIVFQREIKKILTATRKQKYCQNSNRKQELINGVITPFMGS